MTQEIRDAMLKVIAREPNFLDELRRRLEEDEIVDGDFSPPSEEKMKAARAERLKVIREEKTKLQQQINLLEREEGFLLSSEHGEETFPPGGF